MRERIAIDVDGARLAAWHYPGDNGALVVMAGGAGIVGDLATAPFAVPFQAAGFSVLSFDYRGFGESGGSPRGVVGVRRQLADWDAAIAAGRRLPRVDGNRVAIWGASLSGGHVLRVAGRDPRVAAVIAQHPLADGLVALPQALRHETVAVALRMPILAGLDAIRGRLGRSPILVPASGPRGTVAMLTTPDAQQAGQALDPDDRHPEGFEDVAARSVLRLAWYRPGRAAARIQCPVLVVVADDDQSVLAAPALRAARRASAQTLHLVGGHYAAYLAGHRTAVDAELDFLRRRLLGPGEVGRHDAAAGRRDHHNTA